MRFWRRWRMLRWSAIALATMAIGTSAAQAMPVVEQEGGTAKVTPVQAPSAGFDWAYVGVGAGSVPWRLHPQPIKPEPIAIAAKATDRRRALLWNHRPITARTLGRRSARTASHGLDLRLGSTPRSLAAPA